MTHVGVLSSLANYLQPQVAVLRAGWPGWAWVGQGGPGWAGMSTVCKFLFFCLFEMEDILHASNLSPCSSRLLAVHLHKLSELAAGQDFLSLLTHVSPAPRRFKAVELPKSNPNVFKDHKNNTWLSKLPILRAEHKIKHHFQVN